MHFKAILAFAVAVIFAISPLFVRDFAGFGPNQFPIPQVDAPINPARYAFAIWGLIYLWLVISMAFGLIRRPTHPEWQAMRPFLIVSMLLGASWLPVAQLSAVWSTVLIWLMLIAALIALQKAPEHDRWWVRAPLSIYAGWLSAASFVAVGLLLGGHGVLSPHNAAIAVLCAALGFTTIVQIKMGRAPLYGATVVWAFIALVLANFETDPGVAALAGMGALFLSALSFWATYRRTFSTEIINVDDKIVN
ncbi:MAG: hypothetical protein ABJI96_04225 [Paracoccaceae bacterium]